MSKQNVRTKMTVSLAALALGATLASIPAFAQTPGRNANDGGSVSAPGGGQSSGTKPLYNSVSQQKPTTPSYGRNANDGGMVNEPSGGQPAGATSTPQQKPSAPSRNPNDGGVVQ